MPGESLHRLWVTLSEKEQDAIIAQLAACMQALHAWTHPLFGLLATPQLHQPTWHGWLGNRFRQSVEKLRRLESVFPPAILAQVENHFLERQDLLEARKAVLVHHDLWPGNILVQQGKITAILDFEFATWAPPEYELLLIEQFCLYPNDFVEEERATYACSDFASFIQRLRAQAPALFSDPDLRHRLDLYHIEYVLSAYLAWMERQAERQAGLAVNPVAKVLNFLFEDGVRLFDA
jgi:aminoglycoside phosphotransferase (APT) family kinase protein